MRALGWVALLAATSCAPLRLAERLDLSGWYVLTPPAGAASFKSRSAPLALERISSCDAVQRLSRRVGGPVFVTVAGIGGEAALWQQVTAELETLEPAAVVMFRWVPWDESAVLAERFAAGLNTLTHCLPGAAGRTVVLAHSAGGVVVALAADQLVSPSAAGEAPAVTVVTVAAPLAGVDRASHRAKGLERPAIAVDLGGRIAGYPAPADGMSWLHLRTHPGADPVMRPAASGHRPNDPSVGVAGAQHLDLPAHLGHTEAFAWVATALVASKGRVDFDSVLAAAD